MVQIMVDIMHSISYDELAKFQKLADTWNKPLQETFERCMFEKRDEYLLNFKLNVPKEELNEQGSSTRIVL
jgi:2-polyprenyl-3-methyl-5-hydroxy-6-metoxy-1,4-benzoquinol methylase